MKGQITKHEWENTNWGEMTCPHCEVKSVRDFIPGGIRYFDNSGKELLTEPPCITRKIQAHGDYQA